MTDREKIINQIDVDIQRAERTGEMLVHVGRKTAKDAIALLKEQEAEIERLKAQKQKWLQNIADQQLAVSPTGYETEEGLAKRTGEWNGLQMAWEILTKE